MALTFFGRRTKRWIRGSASIEFLIAGMVAVPLFLLVPLIGKQLDTDFRTVQAARYSAWERTIWGEAGSVAKSRGAIGLEVNDRFFGHRSASISRVETVSAEGVTEEPLWRDHKGTSLLANAGTGLPGDGSNIQQRAVPGGGHSAVVRNFAGGGTASILGLGGLGLNTNGYLVSQVTLPLDLDLGAAGRVSVTERADAAILTDAWTADSNRLNRATSLTLQTPVRALVNVGTIVFGSGPAGLFFTEARAGQNADFTPDGNVVPLAYYKE